jgi:predicted MFS family arabinose efflux permease
VISLAVGLSALVAIVLFVMLFLIPVFLQSVQGYSPLFAGLALLPQGLVTGMGTVLGTRLAARRGMRLSAVLGMAILTVSTGTLLAVQLATTFWITALILIGRGLALGLVIQPLLNTMMGSLPRSRSQTAIHSSMWCSAWVGPLASRGSATFFAAREKVRLQESLQALGFSTRDVGQGEGQAISHTCLPPCKHTWHRQRLPGSTIPSGC